MRDEKFQFPGQQFIARIAKHFLDFCINQLNMAGGVDGNYSLRRRLNKGVEFGLAFLNGAFGLLAFVDIAGNVRDGDNAPGTVSDRRNTERDMNRATVFSDTNSVEGFYALIPIDALQNLSLFVMAVGRKQKRQGPAHRFGCGIVIHTSRC